MATPRGAEHRDLEQRLRNIEAQLRELTGAALRREQLAVTQGDFVVSGGGGVIVKDGGVIEAHRSDGTTALRYGPLDRDGDPTTTGGEGLLSTDETGRSIAWLGTRTDGGSRVQLFDHGGALILASSTSGKGMSRPNVHYWMERADTTGFKTTATTFQAAFKGAGNLWAPGLVCKVSTAGTGRARLMADGTQVGSVHNFTNGGIFYLSGDIPAGVSIGQTVDLEVQMRSESGTEVAMALLMLRGGTP